MNYHTDIGNFRGSLLGRGAYQRGELILKLLLFGGAHVRSFMVVQNDKSVYDII